MQCDKEEQKQDLGKKVTFSFQFPSLIITFIKWMSQWNCHFISDTRCIDSGDGAVDDNMRGLTS